MDKITFYLLMGSLSLPLTVSGCVGLSKTEELKHTTWIPSNSQLLQQPVDLKNCLDKEQHLVARQLTVRGIGVILHPNVFNIRTQAWEQVLEPDEELSPPAFAKTEVGISVIPYVTDSSQNKFMLLPKLSTKEQPFNKFAPACYPGLQGLGETIMEMPYYYPTMIIKVIPGQRDNLIKFLHHQRQIDCQFGEFTATPVIPSQTLHNKPLELFLTEIFNKPEALFLRSFANAQTMFLDEAQIKFQVGQTDKPETKPVAVTQINQSTTSSAAKIQIQFIWPKILGKLVITGCEAAQATDSEYMTTCSFQAGHTYHISRPSSSPQPVEIILTWQEELGQLSIPACQIPVANPVGYRSICAFQTGKTYRIVPPFFADTAWQPIETWRRLLVISLSADFNNDGTGKIIQNSLYGYFKQRPANNPPFTLLTIGAGRQLSHPLLTSEELPTLIAKANSDPLQERIKQLQFSATDLNALDDLELVDSYILHHELPISEIMYITDNVGIPNQLPRKQLGVPLAWHQEGIQLTVLTTSDCHIWSERALARCTTWQNKQSPTLKAFLTDF